MKKVLNCTHVRNLVSKNRLDDALVALLNIAELISNRKSRDTIQVLQSRNKYLDEQERIGTIKSEELEIGKNKIRNSILSECRSLEDQEYEADNSGENKQVELSEDDVFRVMKTAIITVELDKIDEEFDNSRSWEEKEITIRKLFKYSKHTTFRLAKEVFRFLSDIASLTRSGMNPGTASAIESLVIGFFPYPEKENDRDTTNELAFQCIRLADNLFYDAAIHLRNLKVGVYGLQILKWIYWIGKEDENTIITEEVLSTYQELEQTIKRPERNDLDMTLQLLLVFKDDLENQGLSIPFMSDELYILI